MPVTRREFCQLSAFAIASVFLPACSSPTPDSPTQIPTRESFTLKDYMNPQNEIARNALVSEMANLLITRTGVSEDKKEKLTKNWEWGFSSDDRQTFMLKHTEIAKWPNFNAITLQNRKTDTRLTFVDLNRMASLNNGEPLVTNGYTDAQRLLLLKAMVLHEMERKLQDDMIFDPPFTVYNPLNPETQLFEVQSTHGFDLFTTKDQKAGIYIDEAVAEAAAAVTLGDAYFGGNPKDTTTLLYKNLEILVSSLDIDWQTVFDLHRRGDAFGFGTLVSEKLGYIPDVSDTVVQSHLKASVGFQIADKVAYGDKLETQQFLDLLHIDSSILLPQNKVTPVGVTDWPIYSTLFSRQSSRVI
jgi:hypothetical protein